MNTHITNSSSLSLSTSTNNLYLSLVSFPFNNSMGYASPSTQQHEQDQQPNSYFDLIPDHILNLILNKILDAKTLVRCLTLSKRFASIIPLTDTVSLPLFLPPPPRHHNNHTPIRFGGNPVNILKSVVNFIFVKPLHHLRRRRRHLPCRCPSHFLRSFRHITHLHFELHTYGGSVDADFLKWKATYGSHLKTCVVLCATSSGRVKPEGETTSSSSSPVVVPNAVFKSRIMWTISCLIAASARHFLMKQMLLQFPALRSIVITDPKRQGRFSMEEGEIRDLRDSLKRDGAALMSPETNVVRDLRMTMRYVPELELPASGCVMEGATLLVIGTADGEEVPATEEEEVGINGGFDGDAAEKAMFGEAEREIVKRKEKSSYVMEMTSF